MLLKDAVNCANTGLDAIKRAPIIQYPTDCKCLRIQDVTQCKQFEDWGYTLVSMSDKNKYLLKKGDIIIARTGATVGANKYIKSNVNSVYNNGLIRLRCNSDYLPYYVYLAIQTDSFATHIKAVSCGTSAQPNLQIGDLLKFSFKEHTKIEQQHIVDSKC